jgi:hypothetical protein
VISNGEERKQIGQTVAYDGFVKKAESVLNGLNLSHQTESVETQLGRIHHELFSRPEHDHKSIRNHAAMDLALGNWHKAGNILRRGLKICDKEEICEHDDGSSRLYHVYMELRRKKFVMLVN